MAPPKMKVTTAQKFEVQAASTFSELREFISSMPEGQRAHQQEAGAGAE